MSSNTMDSPQKMDLFSGVSSDVKTDEDAMPPLKEHATEQELLDYMVLALTRNMTCSAAFKGGYMLNKILGGHSRLTHDIDLSIAKKGDYEGTKKILALIGDKFCQSGYISRYEIKEDIAERCSGGVDMYDQEGKKILGVDIGLHDISYGIRHYNIKFTDIEAFTVERMLSDKLIAITTRKRFRRTKDLYDFYAITNFFDIDYQKLRDYIEKRGGAEWDNIPFNDNVLVQYKYAWDKLDLQSFNGVEQIEKPEFNDAINRFYKFALPLKYDENFTLWEHENGRFV